ncbi:MAG: helix-hairpin-helix domain-containing protein [Firmicutes bacterium]|nr:helix-hairpin-helix domain-containing protein [Bacillota bacterium]
MNEDFYKKLKTAAIAAFVALTAAGNIPGREAAQVTVERDSYTEHAVSSETSASGTETSASGTETSASFAETSASSAESAQTEESPEGEAEPPEDVVPDTKGLIDLNGASQQELESLKGIGPAKAKAIIAYREAHGGFICAEEITEVKGIGAGIYEKIKDSIYVSPR